MIKSIRYSTELLRPMESKKFFGMEKLAQPVQGGGCTTPTLFHYIYQQRSKLWCTVYTPAERADTLPLFLLYRYMHSVHRTLLTETESTENFTKYTLYIT
jgi:hypothetical protein